MPTESKPIKFPIVPLKYAGKWIAWNHERTRIVASGRTVQEVMNAAKAAGEADSILEKVRTVSQRCVSLRRPNVTPRLERSR